MANPNAQDLIFFRGTKSRNIFEGVAMARKKNTVTQSSKADSNPDLSFNDNGIENGLVQKVPVSLKLPGEGYHP